MKMTWLHKFFGPFFIPANGQAKSSPTADFDGAAIPPPIFFMLELDILPSLKSLVWDSENVVYFKNEFSGYSRMKNWVQNRNKLDLENLKYKYVDRGTFWDFALEK